MKGSGVALSPSLEVAARHVALHDEPVLLMVPTLFGVAVLVFVLLRLAPGDPVQMMLEGANVSPSRSSRQSAPARSRPATLRAVSKWFGALLKGDLGVSIWTGRPVLYEIGIRLQLSLQVASWPRCSP